MLAAAHMLMHACHAASTVHGGYSQPAHSQMYFYFCLPSTVQLCGTLFSSSTGKHITDADTALCFTDARRRKCYRALSNIQTLCNSIPPAADMTSAVALQDALVAHQALCQICNQLCTRGSVHPAQLTAALASAATAQTALIASLMWCHQHSSDLAQCMGGLQAALLRLKEDDMRLVLRNLSSQCTNKLARISTPSLTTPRAAKYSSLPHLDEFPDHNPAALYAMLGKFPGATSAMCEFAKDGTAVAQPAMLTLADGSCVPPTVPLLAEIIESQCGGTALLPGARTCLQLLVALSEQLHEPLFVDTS